LTPAPILPLTLTSVENLHPGAPTIIVHLGKDWTAGVNDTGGQFAASSANGTGSAL
jgi:hypothetical protein